jgi:hypothetical protein
MLGYFCYYLTLSIIEAKRLKRYRSVFASPALLIAKRVGAESVPPINKATFESASLLFILDRDFDIVFIN